MGMPENVARIRMWYHLEAIDINNVLNQLHMRDDDKAEEIGKRHLMTLVNDIWPRLGIKL